AEVLPKAEVDRIVRPLTDDGWAAGIVVGLVNQRGTQVLGYGKASDAAGAKAPDGETVFEIGSISKVFTATLLSEMALDKSVALNDPVKKYLPESVKVPSRGGREITLLELSTQHSGLPRMPGNFHSKDPNNPYADYTVENMYAFLSSCELAR